MAFHVRLTKHNLLKLSKYRALPYATLADDKAFDRRQCDHFPESKNKICLAATGQDNQHDTHIFMTRSRSCSSLLEGSRSCSSLLEGSRSGLIPHGEYLYRVFLSGTQVDDSSSEHETCDGQHARSQIASETRLLLPVTLNDLQSLILCNDWHRLSLKEQDCFKGFVKPVSYTGDDILVSEGRGDPRLGHGDIISHENHDVTVLKQSFGGPVLSFQDSMTVLCDGTNTSKEETPQGPGPSKEQLVVVERFFTESLPSFMRSRQDYRIFHKDIILENNYWGKNVISRGITEYVLQMTKFRMLTHFKYAHAQLQILKITHHVEDGTVRIRWRISGLPQLKTLMIWRFMPWNYKKNRDTDSEWYDGFSTMTVGTDGLVHKHRVDRVMTDEELQTMKQTSVAAKLAIILGLTPKPSLNDFTSFFMKKTLLDPK